MNEEELEKAKQELARRVEKMLEEYNIKVYSYRGDVIFIDINNEEVRMPDYEIYGTEY